MQRLRALYRRFVSQRLRIATRRLARELPIRVVDAIPDLLDRSMPPAKLRAAVGIDSSRSHYLQIGKQVANDLLAVAPNGGRWLDFGCGSGRVARHIAAIKSIQLTGVDVDPRGVKWCARNLRGDFREIAREPPLPFPDRAFDVIYAISVVTHLDEATQLCWLRELRRVLREGGMLLASTHSPELTYNRPDLTRAHHEELTTRGFTFIEGGRGFNEDSAFHHRGYIEGVWAQFFRRIEYRPRGVADYQDLTVCVA
jgi:SAM-dependent methyltransferase